MEQDGISKRGKGVEGEGWLFQMEGIFVSEEEQVVKGKSGGFREDL